MLQLQPWPGNVRQLQQVIHRIILSSTHSTIEASLVARALAADETDGRPRTGPWSGKMRRLREWEEEAIRRALRETGGSKAEAARLLGIHRNTLLSKLKKMGIHE